MAQSRGGGFGKDQGSVSYECTCCSCCVTVLMHCWVALQNKEGRASLFLSSLSSLSLDVVAVAAGRLAACWLWAAWPLAMQVSRSLWDIEVHGGLRLERARSKRNTDLINPFRTAVPFWGQTIQSPSTLSPKRDCGSKGVKRDTDLREIRIEENADLREATWLGTGILTSISYPFRFKRNSGLKRNTCFLLRSTTSITSQASHKSYLAPPIRNCRNIEVYLVWQYQTSNYRDLRVEVRTVGRDRPSTDHSNL